MLAWGGLRGALSMALSFASEMPSRELIVSMTLGVVRLTMLLRGTTMTPRLRFTRVAAEQ